MVSLNLGWIGDNWFGKPTNPTSPLISINQTTSHKPSQNPNFSSISISNLFGKPKKPKEEEPSVPPETSSEGLFEQYIWECVNLPDHRHSPEVEKLLKQDPFVEEKENPSEEEIRENAQWWKDFSKSPVVKFLKRVEEIDDKINEMELKENEVPFMKEDHEHWKALPNVPGLNGRPMPRKALKTTQEADDKFWDFTKQFFFGLWGFRQRPYPPGRPIDVAQAIGYKNLEKRYHDFIMRSVSWYYKDRLGRTRGPAQLITLKSAWGAGIIDKDTFIWGEDMDEWAPIHMVYGMERAIATWEVRFGASATAFLHKLQKGIPPWVPLKVHEKKTYKQLQQEAIESKRRDLAVLEANGGIWPGVRTPSHALFLWASGSELTTMLETDHMPNKYIPKDLRIELARLIPGLRPWEVLSIEQAMDQITYGGKWYRMQLGTHTTGPPYIEDWMGYFWTFYHAFKKINSLMYRKMERTIPGFNDIMKKVRVDTYERFSKRLETRKELEEKRRE